MVSSQLFLISLGFFAINLRNVRAISEAEKSAIYASILQDILECTTKVDIGIDLTKLLNSMDDLEGINPCFLACIFKKNKLIDSKGMYDKKGSEEFGRKFMSSEEDIKNSADIIKECISVNDKEVSDGEKGCDRSKLLAECFLPHRQLFMPK